MELVSSSSPVSGMNVKDRISTCQGLIKRSCEQFGRHSCDSGEVARILLVEFRGANFKEISIFFKLQGQGFNLPDNYKTKTLTSLRC